MTALAGIKENEPGAKLQTQHRVSACAYSVAQSCPAFCGPWKVSDRPLCPWDFPGKNTGVGCHFFLQGIFPTQGSNSNLGNFFTTELPGKPRYSIICEINSLNRPRQTQAKWVDQKWAKICRMLLIWYLIKIKYKLCEDGYSDMCHEVGPGHALLHHTEVTGPFWMRHLEDFNVWWMEAKSSKCADLLWDNKQRLGCYLAELESLAKTLPGKDKIITFY